ncbi:efflux RND transporter periplasmic adaptor subunit [Sinomicrobium sp. M5D2P17]
MNQRNKYKAFTAGLCCLLLVSCGNQEKEKENNIPHVNTVHPSRARLYTDVTVSGTIGNESQIVLSFKTGGMVDKVNTKEGDYVEKGAVLATLNTTELDAQMQQSRLKIEKLQRDLERTLALVKDTITTLEQLQDLETNLHVAQQEKASLAFNRSQSVLRAPKSGFIITQQLALGEYKTPGSPAITIGSQGDKTPGHWIFTAGLPDKDRVLLQQGKGVSVRLDVFPGEKFPGTIIQLSSVPNPQTGTYEITVTFNARDKQIVYGLTGELLIPVQDEKDCTVLPVEAFVSMENQQGIIYTLDHGNKVVSRTVHITKVLKDKIAIEDRLAEEMQIITKGKLQAVAGKTVQIVN